MNIWDPLNNSCVPRKDFNQSCVEGHDQYGMMMSMSKSLMCDPLQQIERGIMPVRDNTLAEVLGLKTVEKVKDLCRAYGIRTTRAGTNGGRKSKGELIDDLLAAGVTRIDDTFVKSMGKEKRKRTAPSSVQSPKPETEEVPVDVAPVYVAPVVKEEVVVKDTSSGRLDSLAEVAYLALLEHQKSTDSGSSLDTMSSRMHPEESIYRPSFTSLSHGQSMYQMPRYTMHSNRDDLRSPLSEEASSDQSLSWDQVNAPSSHPSLRAWA
jgi:hypothetical protein